MLAARTAPGGEEHRLHLLPCGNPHLCDPTDDLPIAIGQEHPPGTTTLQPTCQRLPQPPGPGAPPRHFPGGGGASLVAWRQRRRWPDSEPPAIRPSYVLPPSDLCKIPPPTVLRAHERGRVVG